MFIPKRETGQDKDYIFSEETIQALANLGNVLAGIHRRMIAEGYEIKDGKVVKKE